MIKMEQWSVSERLPGLHSVRGYAFLVSGSAGASTY